MSSVCGHIDLDNYILTERELKTSINVVKVVTVK